MVKAISKSFNKYLNRKDQYREIVKYLIITLPFSFYIFIYSIYVRDTVNDSYILGIKPYNCFLRDVHLCI